MHPKGSRLLFIKKKTSEKRKGVHGSSPSTRPVFASASSRPALGELRPIWTQSKMTERSHDGFILAAGRGRGARRETVAERHVRAADGHVRAVEEEWERAWSPTGGAAVPPPRRRERPPKLQRITQQGGSGHRTSSRSQQQGLSMACDYSFLGLHLVREKKFF